MNIYTQKQRWKILLLITALLIGTASLWYTNRLVKKLSEEERKKIELWAEATRRLADVTEINSDINFLSNVISNNNTIPVFPGSPSQVFLMNQGSCEKSLQTYHPPR